MPNHFQNTHTIVDTSAPLSLIAPNGYYEVGNKIFNYKIHALQEGSRTGLPVHWNFNDEVFNNFNWTKRLNIPLLELYRMRAQQIRQKYKWISLLWSGGADSTAMMESFLDNNIHLDEVVVLWPTSMSAGKYTPKWDRSRFNMMSEWDLTIKPGIERLQAKYPKLQITVVDTFEKPPTDEDREDTAIIVEKHSYGTIQKYRALDALLKQRVEKYDSVGTVVGSSPVELRILNNRFLATFFSDIAAYPASKTDITLDGWVRNMEFFYWSPEFPELIAKQAHVILDHINLVPKSRIFINQFSNFF